jgi:hypothetical protein
MSIDWWNTLIIGLLVLGGAGVYGIWRLARVARAWRRAGRLVDSLADLDAYPDELEPLPDEWDDQTLAELRDDLSGPARRETLCGPDPIAGTGADRVEPSGSRAMQPHVSEGRAGELHPEQERLPEMLYADGYPVFASLLESAAWDAHWEQAWGELQRARESAWEWYRAPERCWAGVATGTFPAVTG